MMAHSISAGELAVQAKIMADAGCQCVYVVDSAGALILDEVTDRILAVREAVGPDTQVGFHGHQNLSLAVANTILAIRAGAVQVEEVPGFPSRIWHGFILAGRGPAGHPFSAGRSGARLTSGRTSELIPGRAA